MAFKATYIRRLQQEKGNPLQVLYKPMAKISFLAKQAKQFHLGLLSSCSHEELVTLKVPLSTEKLSLKRFYHLGPGMNSREHEASFWSSACQEKALLLAPMTLWLFTQGTE